MSFYLDIVWECIYEFAYGFTNGFTYESCTESLQCPLSLMQYAFIFFSVLPESLGMGRLCQINQLDGMKFLIGIQ